MSFATKVLLRSEESGGHVSMVENVLPPHCGGPHLHTHDFDEAFYVLEGELVFQVEDELVTKRAGEFAFAPRGVPHTLANHSDAPARYVLVITPAGFERYFGPPRVEGDEPPEWALQPIPEVDARRAADSVGRMSARRAIFIAPFDELSEPGIVAELAVRAEERGLGRVLRLGPHRLPRAGERRSPTRGSRWPRSRRAPRRSSSARWSRRSRAGAPHQLARETVTLDRLSGGRLVLGVGARQRPHAASSTRTASARRATCKARAKLLDDGLERLRPTGAASSSRGRCSSHGSRSGSPSRWPNRGPLRARGALRRRVPDRSARPGGAGRGASPSCRRGGLRRRRHEPGRHRPRAVGGGRRDVVPDGLRPAADRRRGRAGDRLRAV